MTSNILHHLNDLKTSWRKQDFKLSREQQEQYDILLVARRERVSGFYATGRVFKGSKAAFDKLAIENQVVVEQEEE
tara:strand:- start:567 stop:794 length:228 start_codon:yes stop_codon:yes gene_type:complete